MEALQKRVLVVEDDVDTRALLVDVLEADGFYVSQCVNGEQALEQITAERFDLVVSDIKMPYLSGTELLFAIRQLGLQTSVVLMTAYASVDSAVQALHGNACDYLIKPFTLDDLRKAVQRALRPAGMAGRPGRIVIYHDLVLDEDNHKVWKGAQEIILTRNEFRVLAHMMRSVGRIVSIEELLQYGWQCESPEERSPTTVKTCIFRLREKIEDNPREPTYIRNVWGVGYQFGD